MNLAATKSWLCSFALLALVFPVSVCAQRSPAGYQGGASGGLRREVHEFSPQSGLDQEGPEYDRTSLALRADRS